MVEDYSRACQRERGEKKEEEAQKPLPGERDLNPRTLSPEPSMPSIRPRRPAIFVTLMILVRVVVVVAVVFALVAAFVVPVNV